MSESQMIKFYENLPKSEQSEFARIIGNSEKFKFAKHLTQKYKEFFKFNPAIGGCAKKDDGKSISFRIDGNNLYIIGRYQDALKAYNKSLCFAISDINLAIEYACRSAACFQMGRFSDCRENIALTRKFECLPEPMKRKLLDREEKCQGKNNSRILSYHTFVEYIKNSNFNKNPNIPFLSNRVGVKMENSKYKIYAKEYIEPGVLVIKETFINRIMCVPVNYLNCYYCLNLSNNLIPYPNCMHAAFCNEECMKRANEEFHRWECDIMDLLYFLDCELLWLSYRLLIKMLNVFGDYIELEKYWKRISKKSRAWYFFEADRYDEITHFEALHAVQPTITSKVFNLIISIVSVVFTTEATKYCKPLQEFFKTSQQKDLFGEIILHNMLTYSEIGNGLNEENMFNNDAIFTSLGSVVLPELKRSSCPNMKIELSATHLYFVTTCPILKGEFLTVRPTARQENDDGNHNSEVGSMLEKLLFLNILNTVSRNAMPLNVPFNFR